MGIKKLKINYLLIPIITVLVSYTGSIFTSMGISSGWYDLINKPTWTPPGSVIGIVWTIIFILSTISALIVWNKIERNKRFWRIILLFLINAALNVFWSFLFFAQNLIGLAVLEAALLAISVYILIYLIWPRSKLAAVLLIPYALWVSFATFLNYSIWVL
ncbi:MAG: TspO/MBR family protein [Minisyncoccales bacterium]